MLLLLEGKVIKENMLSEVKSVIENEGLKVGLAVVLVGEDKASKIYVRNKKKACEEVGIKSFVYELPEDATENEVIELIKKLNNDTEVTGILVQLPLPKHINKELVIETIDYKKDVDCFHPYNVGMLIEGNPTIKPCTPFGIMEMFKYYKIDLLGKNCVMIGCSNLVGKPLANLLMVEHATVTVAHSKTKDLKSHTLMADIIIVAVGKRALITADMVKDGAVVVDVGINRDENNKIVGDVDFDRVSEKASWITPVPGGVGLLTIGALMKNCVATAKLQQ